MPYSRSKEKRLAKLVKWPDIRYSPTGEIKLFYSAKEVPFDWSIKPPGTHFGKPAEALDKAALMAALTEKGIEINPTWGSAHMKKVLNDCSTSR